MKILLGGIPLGCDNIGDEAILACVCEILRRNFPGCELTVCTADPSTAGKLGVECAPLFGFSEGASVEAFARFVPGFDLFLWAGATGLSDYPETAAQLLETAQKARIRCAVWCVGMNSELNPAFFKVRGKKLALLKILSFCCANTLDFPRIYEWIISTRMRRRLGKILKKCAFVSVRDPESARELARCGFTESVISADSALLNKTGIQNFFRRQRGVRTIGFCFSAQQPIHDEAAILRLLNRLLEEKGTRLVFLPMNPRSDASLMRSLQQQLEHRSQTLLVTDVFDPGTVQALTAECDLVVSSRLHLLILAANVNTPLVGIARGSKVANFLNNFELIPACSVTEFDAESLFCEIERLSDRDYAAEFRKRCETARTILLERLAKAEAAFRKAISG